MQNIPGGRYLARASVAHALHKPSSTQHQVASVDKRQRVAQESVEYLMLATVHPRGMLPGISFQRRTIGTNLAGILNTSLEDRSETRTLGLEMTGKSNLPHMCGSVR